MTLMLVSRGPCSGPVSVGCLAGDAQSYILFCDFFDRVIEAHHEHKVTNETPASDFNCDNLKVAVRPRTGSTLLSLWFPGGPVNTTSHFTCPVSMETVHEGHGDGP